MENTPAFLTIKEAAQQFKRSEQTIRRLAKQHALTSHVRLEQTPKGNAYLISQVFLQEQYISTPVTSQNEGVTSQENGMTSQEESMSSQEESVTSQTDKVTSQEDSVTNHSEQLLAVVVPDQLEEIIQLKQQLSERDQTIQQLQHRLLEQNDVLNALTGQVNSQRIGHIEELLLRQNEQLNELQKRLPEPSEIQSLPARPEPSKKGFWQRLFGA